MIKRCQSNHIYIFLEISSFLMFEKYIFKLLKNFLNLRSIGMVEEGKPIIPVRKYKEKNTGGLDNIA